MNHAFYLFAASVGLASILAAISIWSPRATWIKVSALVIAAVFLPVTYVSLVELLSRPKPIALEWAQRDLSEAVVLDADLREGESIYLWLRVAGVEEPRSYVLPWDRKLAEQLYGAQREANSNGTAVHMKYPFVNGQEPQPPMFYALPQPPRPPKEIPTEGPLIYQPADRGDARRAV